MNGKVDWLEIKRKTFHIIGGIILALLIYYDILKAWMVLLMAGAGIIISMTYALADIPLIHFFLKKFEREHLRKKFPGKGVIYLFLAILFMMLMFEKNIVVAGILIWAFGDGISALVGKHYGTIRHPLNTTRMIEGTLAGMIAASIAASFFVYWPFAIIASTIAMIVESIEWELYKQPFDDNFFVPVVGAFVIYFLMIIF